MKKLFVVRIIIITLIEVMTMIFGKADVSNDNINNCDNIEICMAVNLAT